ncbi:MAG: efflux RND transporter periplasmic adaptor subunit, partial [Ignavibacteria bacterium]|nr:efflux RND transporter periplasmic adaptor subunit [Ignavibacteria bacterium]
MAAIKISKKTAFVLLLLIAVVVIVYAFLPASGNEETAVDDSRINYGKLNEVIFNVRTDIVKRGNLILSISGNGLVKAGRELDLVSNISGFVDNVFIYEGKKVNKGDLLIKLDDSEQKISLSESEVNLTNAKIEYGFLSKEIPSGMSQVKADSISELIKQLDEKFSLGEINKNSYLSKKEELDLALIFTGAKRDEVILNKSGLTNAINAMNKAKLNLAYTEIRAPFSGVVADFNLVERQRINAGEKIFKLLDIDKYKIEVGVIESEIANIKNKSEVVVKLNSLPGAIFKGRVLYINPLIDSETKTCRVTILVPNNDSRVKPGMFANVLIENQILKDKLLIPKDALLVRDKRDLVFV